MHIGSHTIIPTLPCSRAVPPSFRLYEEIKPYALVVLHSIGRSTKYRLIYHEIVVSMRGTIGYAAPEYGLGNEVPIHGDVYSYGILFLEMFTGKRPTDSEFGESFGLHKNVQMALPERAAEVIDRDLLAETEYGKESSSNSSSNMDLRIACITSVLCTGISCSQETPMDRIQIGGALKELLAIRDRFDKELCAEGDSAN